MRYRKSFQCNITEPQDRKPSSGLRASIKTKGAHGSKLVGPLGS